MKKFLLLFGAFVFFLVARPAYADSSVCNRSCQVNEDCGKGYRCYVGICRAVSCPSSPTCACDLAASPTPSPLIRTKVDVAPTPSPKATPIPARKEVAQRAPRTGVSLLPSLVMVGILAISGLVLTAYAKE